MLKGVGGNQIRSRMVGLTIVDVGRWFTLEDFKIENPFYSWGLKDIPA